MPQFAKVNFNEAPPAQTGGSTISDYIEPGTYTFSVDSLTLEGVRNQPGEEQFVLRLRCESGDFAGRVIIDRFRVPSATFTSKFPMQRFHAFLIELGVKLPGLAFQFDMETLVGKRIDVLVKADIMPANGNFPEREVGAVDLYMRIAGGVSAATNGAAPAAAAQPPAARKPAASRTTRATAIPVAPPPAEEEPEEDGFAVDESEDPEVAADLFE